VQPRGPGRDTPQRSRLRARPPPPADRPRPPAAPPESSPRSPGPAPVRRARCSANHSAPRFRAALSSRSPWAADRRHTNHEPRRGRRSVPGCPGRHPWIPGFCRGSFPGGHGGWSTIRCPSAPHRGHRWLVPRGHTAAGLVAEPFQDLRPNPVLAPPFEVAAFPQAPQAAEPLAHDHGGAARRRAGSGSRRGAFPSRSAWRPGREAWTRGLLPESPSRQAVAVGDGDVGDLTSASRFLSVNKPRLLSDKPEATSETSRPAERRCLAGRSRRCTICRASSPRALWSCEDPRSEIAPWLRRGSHDAPPSHLAGAAPRRPGSSAACRPACGPTGACPLEGGHPDTAPPQPPRACVLARELAAAHPSDSVRGPPASPADRIQGTFPSRRRARMEPTTRRSPPGQRQLVHRALEHRVHPGSGVAVAGSAAAPFGPQNAWIRISARRGTACAAVARPEAPAWPSPAAPGPRPAAPRPGRAAPSGSAGSSAGRRWRGCTLGW
jgi:hypothetical protein